MSSVEIIEHFTYTVKHWELLFFVVIKLDLTKHNTVFRTDGIQIKIASKIIARARCTAN